VKILSLSADLGIPVLGGKGAAVHVRAMAHALSDAGHDVVLVAAARTKSPWDAPAPCPVPVVHVPPPPLAVEVSQAVRAFARQIGAADAAAGEVRRVAYDRELLAALRRTFEHDPPALVYERASLLSTAGLAFAREVGAVHLLELNAPLSDEHQRYRNGGALAALASSAEAWLLAGTDGVLAVSSPLATYVRALGTPADRVHVVPNGVDTATFAPGPPTPGLRARYGLGPGPVLAFVGGLRPWHGVESLPAIVEQVARRHPDVQLLVVGDGPLRGVVEQEARALGVGARVRCTGPVPHDLVAPLLREAAVALAPYPAPAHAFYFSPLKVFEYMASGVPTVAPAIGQIADLVRDGDTGLLYPAGDVEACAARCVALLDAPAAAARLGAAAAAHIRGHHTWAHNARRVVALAHEAAARAQGVPA
jgi:glycosyltransferase involved in cell wall biosynthesis